MKAQVSGRLLWGGIKAGNHEDDRWPILPKYDILKRIEVWR